MSKRHLRHGKRGKVGHGKLRNYKRKNSERRQDRGRGPTNRPVARRQPPQRSSKRPTVTKSNSGSQELLSEMSMLESRERSLKLRADLNSIQTDIADIANAFFAVPTALRELNERGFVFTKDIEDDLAIIENQWHSEIEDDVEDALKQALATVAKAEQKSDRQMDRLTSPSQSLINQAQTQLENLDSTIRSAEQNLRAHYRTVKNKIDEIQFDIAEAEQTLNLLHDSKIKLRGSEAPILAVDARWERDGEDEGPKGHLYLTDQRILFEQKEKVAEKKILFITTESKMVQKIWVDEELRHIKTIDHEEERRGMLNMKRREILSLVLQGQANSSRLKFQLVDQEAADWAEEIKLVLAGETAKDHFDYDPESESVTYTFPTECSNCLASVPPQPAGVHIFQCDFCNSTIQAEAS